MPADPPLTTGPAIPICERMDTGEPLVSICCIAYNQEEFVGAALEGFVAQRTSFPVEILIHDDASTDRTASIIRNFEHRYPHLINAIYQTENQHSRGVRVGHLNYMRARGKYIAFCEGDDAWTDPFKLEKQIALMMRHPQCHLSFHPVREIDYANDLSERIVGVYGKVNRVVGTDEIIVKKHGMLPTASCVATTEAVEKFMAFTRVRPYLTVGDIYMQIITSLHGGALYIHDTMALYRTRTAGSWTLLTENDNRRRLAHIHARVKSFLELDDLTAARFRKAIRHANRKSILGVLRSDNFSSEDKAALYAAFRSALRLTDKLGYHLRSRFARPSSQTGNGKVR